MLNSNYAPEIATANQFIIDHNNDTDFMDFLATVRETVRDSHILHSDRWSLIYNWMQNHHPEATGSLITGLTYWVEG